MDEVCEGDKINDNIDGNDVGSIEEAEMRSSMDSVNGNEYMVSEFDASTSSGDNFMTFLRTRTKLLMGIQFFESTLINKLVRKGQ